MPEVDRAPGLELAPPMPLRASPLAAGLAAAAVAVAMIWLAGSAQHAGPKVPASPADLSDSVVTEIDVSNGGAITAALSMLRLPEAQRQQIAQEVLRRERRLGWIVLVDSMDPDGDTVAVESAGLVQHVLLSKAWMPVAVPLGGSGAPIGVTAVRDGGGGGVTVALATRRGPMALRALLPGERIEVMP